MEGDLIERFEFRRQARYAIEFRRDREGILCLHLLRFEDHEWRPESVITSECILYSPLDRFEKFDIVEAARKTRTIPDLQVKTLSKMTAAEQESMIHRLAPLGNLKIQLQYGRRTKKLEDALIFCP